MPSKVAAVVDAFGNCFCLVLTPGQQADCTRWPELVVVLPTAVSTVMADRTYDTSALLGIHKAQVSKLERSAVNVTVATLLKVFAALHTKLKLSFKPLQASSPQVVAIFIFSALLNALAQQPGFLMASGQQLIFSVSETLRDD